MSCRIVRGPAAAGRVLKASEAFTDPKGLSLSLGMRHRIAAACGLALAAGSVLAGASSTAYAAASSASTCRFREVGTSATVVIACAPGGPAPAPATSRPAREPRRGRPAVGGVHPDATPSDSLCTGVDVNYYGWFGIEPGSTADGGLSGLWLDANSGASAVSVESGDGSTGQQWCEEDAGGGAYYFYEEAGTYPQCLTVISGAAPAT